MADVPVLFPKWQPQLTAAINETDPARLLERVREVQEILSKRLDRILGSGSHSGEIHAIEQAMDALEILKRKSHAAEGMEYASALSYGSEMHLASQFPRQLFSRSIVLSVFLFALTAASGKSLKMVTSWFNPNYEGQKFHKILVIGVAQDLKVRADFEDGMAAQIGRPGIQTIPGNQILLRPDPKAKPDLDYLRAQIRDNHIDAVVVSRLLKVDRKVTSIPSSTYVAPFPYYYSFYGYLGAVYPVVYDPGYTREDTTVSVETNVYATSKPDGDLVWTGVTDSFNPKSAKKVADGLVKEVPKQMEKDGLLPKNSATN
jgi:hypothetical protein